MSNTTWSASTERRPRSWIARHQLTAYLVLAFALSWSVWPLVLLNPTSSPMVPFGPALAALTVTALVGGRTAVLRLLGQLTRWRLGARWYLAALSPFAITALVGLLAVGAGAPVPSLDDLSTWPTAVPTVFLSTVLIVGLFEEPGWRGYALPRLQRDHGALAAALVLGVVWLLWHLPLLLSDPTGQRPLLPFVITVLAQSVIMTWLYNSTGGSLPAVMIFHAAVDTAARFVLPEFAGAAYLAVWWLTTGLYVLVAGAIIWRTRPATG
jgi:membrane protease YdiL (CAAX protease family)